MMNSSAEWASEHRKPTNIRLTGRRSKFVSMAMRFSYHYHEFESFLGCGGLGGSVSLKSPGGSGKRFHPNWSTR
jgi:hypothetical protein